jgi:biopolymer transport protein ExbD/biopolymer transport protein TolR
MAIGGRAGESFTEINVTPLTDVFLVLLVIMILIAPLVNQTVLKVDPPSAGPSQAKQDKTEKITVEVSAAGQIRVNNVPANPPDATGVTGLIKSEQAKQGKTDIPLELSAEGDARQKYVVAVMDAAAGCGIHNLRVMPIKK